MVEGGHKTGKKDVGNGNEVTGRISSLLSIIIFSHLFFYTQHVLFSLTFQSEALFGFSNINVVHAISGVDWR